MLPVAHMTMTHVESAVACLLTYLPLFLSMIIRRVEKRDDIMILTAKSLNSNPAFHVGVSKKQGP